MAVMFMTTDDYTPADDEHVYLDSVGVGNVMVPYAFMSGTSMASPLVAGAASVASTRVDRSLEPSERALQLASLIRGCVTECKDFTGTCTSNGSIDLSKLDAVQERQPQIDQVTTGAADGKATVTVAGSNFGSKTGTARIAGHEAKVISWTDGSVTIERPDAVTSGKRLVEVTTADGKTCSKTTTLAFTGGTSEDDLPLYEEEISLEKTTLGAERSFKMVTVGDDIYVFAGIRDAEKVTDLDLPYRELWRYSSVSKTWTDLGALPEAIGAVSVTVHDGKILVLARGTGGVTDFVEQRLYRYDPQSGEWTRLQEAERAIPTGAAIIDVNGTLLAIGGSQRVEEQQESSLASDNIARIDLDTATATPLGSLVTPRSMVSGKDACDIKLAVSGSTVYVMGGGRVVYEKGASTEFSRSKVVDAMPGTEALTLNADGTYTARDITSQLPAEKKIYDGRFGLAADSDHVMIAGYKTDASDEDTFTLTDSGVKGFGKRANYSELSWADAAICNGRLYVIGADESAGGMAVMRATALPSSPAAPDQPGKPGTGDNGTDSGTTTGGSKHAVAGAVGSKTGSKRGLANTGDRTVAIVAGVAAAGLALVIIGLRRYRLSRR